MATVAGTVLKRLPIKSFESIPGPKSYPFVGTLPHYLPYIGEYNFERYHWNGMINYKRYGKMVKETIIPGVNMLFLFDPVDIEAMFRQEGRYPFRRSHTALEKFRLDTPEQHNSAGVLPTNGVEWGNLRFQYQQSISMENIRAFIPQNDEIISEFLQSITNPMGKPFTTEHFSPYLMTLFLELVGSSIFNHRYNGFSTVGDPNAVPQRLIAAAEKVNSSTALMDNAILGIWRKIDTPLYRAMKSSIGLLEQSAKEIITDRIKDRQNGVNIRPCAIKYWLDNNWVNEKDGINDAVTMGADLILGGIDTTANSTGFILYHLAKNPDKQEKLYAELTKLLPTWDTPVTLELINKASYAKRCVKESLRLNPISVGVGRLLENDKVIGNHHIPQGTVIVTQTQVTSRLEEYYWKPNEFLPERWDPANKRPHPYSALPFGHGARACIARRLAEQNMYMFTIKLFRRFHVKWNSSEPLDCLTHTINKPDAPLRFTFTPRTQ